MANSQPKPNDAFVEIHGFLFGDGERLVSLKLLSYFYAIAADRRTRVQHLFPKPKSSVLMSSHLFEKSSVGLCESWRNFGYVRIGKNHSHSIVPGGLEVMS
jgi:hypothetical protein